MRKLQKVIGLARLRARQWAHQLPAAASNFCNIRAESSRARAFSRKKGEFAFRAWRRAFWDVVAQFPSIVPATIRRHNSGRPIGHELGFRPLTLKGHFPACADWPNHPGPPLSVQRPMSIKSNCVAWPIPAAQINLGPASASQHAPPLLPACIASIPADSCALSPLSESLVVHRLISAVAKPPIPSSKRCTRVDSGTPLPHSQPCICFFRVFVVTMTDRPAYFCWISDVTVNTLFLGRGCKDVFFTDRK